jgi:signal transduction histidine kinase
MARFLRPLLALRWSALTASLVIGLLERRGIRTAGGAGALAVYALWRTLRPIRYEHGGWPVALPLLAEVTLCVVVVETTGTHSSPFLVSLAAAAFIAGFGGGIPLVAGLVVVGGAAYGVPQLVDLARPTTAVPSAQFALELVLIGVIGAYSRYLLDEERGVEQALRVHDLAEVNSLLVELHGATARVSMPLDVGGVVDWTLERTEELWSPDVTAVVLRDPVTDAWDIAGVRGISLPGPSRSIELPPALASAAAGREPLRDERGGTGLSPLATSGIFFPLRAHDRLVGLLAVEFLGPGQCSPTDVERMRKMVDAAALAVDSAQRLRRIAMLAAEEERARVARELHDHIGQSVVSLGFEIDRLIEVSEGRAVQQDLNALRGELSGLVSEVRATLTELRSDVSGERDLATVLHEFVERMDARSPVPIDLTVKGDGRLTVPIEREFWRVAQEAVTNAVRHARAKHISVRWACDGHEGILEVADDGIGLPDDFSRRRRFGLTGMRERAAAIGASLEVSSPPWKGTVVRMVKTARTVT